AKIFFISNVSRSALYNMAILCNISTESGTYFFPLPICSQRKYSSNVFKYLRVVVSGISKVVLDCVSESHSIITPPIDYHPATDHHLLTATIILEIIID